MNAFFIGFLLAFSFYFFMKGRSSAMKENEPKTFEEFKLLSGYNKVLYWKTEVLKWHNGLQLKTPVAFVMGMMATESMGNPEAVGSKGEIGLFQLTYGAYIDSGVNYRYEDLVDPYKNIETGLKYIKWIENYLSHNGVAEDDFLQGVIMSYNIGVGNYLQGKYLNAGQSYFRKVQNHRKEILKYW